MIPGIPSNKDEVKALLEKAAECLFADQPDIYVSTPESTVTEWAVAHHYANAMSHLLPGYACDVEARKTPNGERPDIIIHKRGEHVNNFLVVEIKLRRERESVEDFDPADKSKIKGRLSPGKLRYKFGALVNFEYKNASKRKIKVLVNKPEKAVE